MSNNQITEDFIKDYIAINRHAFDQLSVEYLKRDLIKSDFETPAEYLVDCILNYKNKNDELLVLEVGPGSGKTLRYFESISCRTTAVDLSEKIIDVAKSNSPKTVFIHGNILDVAFYPCQFDVIFAGALIHLFPKNDAKKLVKQFSRWMKEDGVMFINTTINDKSEEGFFIKSDYGNSVKRFRRKWTEKEFNKFITEHFSILKTIYTDEKDRNKMWVGYICKLL